MKHKEPIADPSPDTIRKRKERAAKKAALIEQLGGMCCECGTEERLTFDHIHGRDWDIRAVHSEKRLRIYKMEADGGLLQLLCLSCNSRKGSPVLMGESGEEWDGSF